MNEKLPEITVSTDVAPSEFILRVESMSPMGFQTHRHSTWDDFKKDFCLNIVPNLTTPHEGLFGQLMCAPAWGSITRVEVRAQRWHHVHRPSYATYVSTAKQIFRPILAAYRAQFAARCHMRIQSQDALRPRLPKRTKYFFDQFTAAANITALHSRDWERYYHFIHVAHVGGARIIRDDLIRLLLEKHFSADDAAHLADVYEHGRSLLHHRIIPRYVYRPQTA